MGVDAGDCDGDGDLDLYVTNFYGETNTLYLNSGSAEPLLTLQAERGLAAPTVSYLGWGTRFFDFDFDGDLDLFVANGHIYPQVDDASAGGTYAQRNQLFANEGSGAFAAVEGGGPWIARGAKVEPRDHQRRLRPRRRCRSVHDQYRRQPNALAQ